MDFSVTRGEFIIRRQHEKFFKLLLKHTHPHSIYNYTHTHTLCLSLSLSLAWLCVCTFFSATAIALCIPNPLMASAGDLPPSLLPPRVCSPRLLAASGNAYTLHISLPCDKINNALCRSNRVYREVGRGDCTGYTYKCCAYDKSLCHFYYFMRL